MPRLLRYKGKDTASVDPYWDFEHEPGEAYDMEALRLWRARTYISGPHAMTVRVRLRRGEEELSPAEHVLRYAAGPELSPESYVPLRSSAVQGAPPLLVLAVNLSRLAPGEYVLTTEVVGAEQEDKEMRFRIGRRPFITFHDPIASPEPVRSLSVRSVSGLREVREGGGTRLVTAHGWKVYRNMWTGEGTPGYSRLDPADIVAITLVSDNCAPIQTRWRALSSEALGKLLEAWNRRDFERCHLPEAHAAQPPGVGLGLPFPTLVGLPRQPNGDGGYPQPPRAGDRAPLM